MKMIVTLFAIFAFSSAAFASSAYRECPVPPTTPGADVGKIAGRWYLVLSPNNSTFDFTHREDGDFDLKIFTTLPDGSKSTEYGLAARTDNSNLLNIYNDMSKRVSYQVTFNIAATDYDKYLVAYICHVLPEHSIITGSLTLFRNKPGMLTSTGRFFD